MKKQETKQSEKRIVTTEPKEMLNMYLSKGISKKWIEDFTDEDTGETVSINRSEKLFERGLLINQDTLAQIRFYIEAGDISEVEVSNQRRMAYESENRNSLYPFTAQISMDGKGKKFLLYANCVEGAILVLKDYVELNYEGAFYITLVKQFDSCIILTDNLKKQKVDVGLAYLKGEIDSEEYADRKDFENDEESPDEKKFYSLEVKVIYEEGSEIIRTFVVQTYNVDRAMMIINNYLKKIQDEEEKRAKKKDPDYVRTEIHTMIETAKVLPIGCYIPRDFSLAYLGGSENE